MRHVHAQIDQDVDAVGNEFAALGRQGHRAGHRCQASVARRMRSGFGVGLAHGGVGVNCELLVIVQLRRAASRKNISDWL